MSLDITDLAALLTFSAVGLLYYRKEIGWLVQMIGCVLWIFIGYRANISGLIWLNLALGAWGLMGTARMFLDSSTSRREAMRAPKEGIWKRKLQ